IRMSNQIKNGSGIFCRLPIQHATAAPIHQTGFFRASSAGTKIRTVKRVRPISSKPRADSLEKSGAEMRIARVSGTNQGSSDLSKRTNHATATKVSALYNSGQTRTATARF